MQYSRYIVGYGPMQTAEYISLERFSGRPMVLFEHMVLTQRVDVYTNVVKGVELGAGHDSGLYHRVALSGN